MSVNPAPLSVGLRDSIRTVINETFAAVFDLVVSLFSDIVTEFLRLDPTRLQQFEPVYQLGILVFVGLLGVYGTASFGLFQMFPSTERTDPLRFFGRAVAATTALFVVNPPGWGPTVISRGAFAAAFVLTNRLSTYYLDQVGTTLTFQSDQLANALSGPFVLLAFGLTIGGSILISELALLMLLVLRQVLIFFTYALFPVLICFWVADSGPMRYGQELATRLFRTTTTLLAGGVLIAAIFTVGFGLISGSSQIFAGGTPTGRPAPTDPAVSGGTFAMGGGDLFVLDVLLKAVIVTTMLVVPTLLMIQMLGTVGDAISSAAQAGASLAASAAGGAGAAASVATQAGKVTATQISKRGIRKGIKSSVKKGARQAKRGVRSRISQSDNGVGTRSTSGGLSAVPTADGRPSEEPGQEESHN